MSKLYGLTYDDYISTLSQLVNEHYNGSELEEFMNPIEYKNSIVAYSADDESILSYTEWLNNYISEKVMEGI